MSDSRKALVVKAKGGMGNRMLCAATGMLYGRLCERRVYVDWRDGAYGPNGQNSFGRFFKTPWVETDICLPEDASVFPAVWKNNLSKSVSQMVEQHDPRKHSSLFVHRKYSVDVRRLDYPEDIVVFWNYQHRINGLRRHLPGRFPEYADLSTSGILAKALREFFPLEDSLEDEILSFKKAHFSSPTVGIHIRYSDRKTRVPAYEKALERFLNDVPEALLFLATDSTEILDTYTKRYERVVSTPKWYPSSSGSMHQNRECPDRTQNGKEALKDMVLLSMCDYLIYSSWSTFSVISCLLSGLPKDRVVDIDRFNVRVRANQWLRDTLP